MSAALLYAIAQAARASEAAAPPRLTSMCLEIPPFGHADCPAPAWCECPECEH